MFYDQRNHVATIHQWEITPEFKIFCFHFSMKINGLGWHRSTGFYMKMVKDTFPNVRYEYSLDISTTVYLHFQKIIEVLGF